MSESGRLSVRGRDQEGGFGRKQLCGVREISDALRKGEMPRLLLVIRDTKDPETLAIVEKARKLGTMIRYASANDQRRMCAERPTEDLLALIGPDPGADERTVLRGTGISWLLAGVAYPGNVGFAIRTAEVSGADGIFIDTDLAGRGRHRALRASMGANRFFPVHWSAASRVVGMAREEGKRIVAVEDTGTNAPWDHDLTGSILVAIGGEGCGISAQLQEACDAVLRIPVAGFVPSYNLHAAMAAIAVERLRQVGRRAGIDV